MRVVPVNAGVWTVHSVGECSPDRNQRLGVRGAIEPVLQPHAVPVDRRRHVAAVDYVDHDLGALWHPQRRARNRSVVGEHPYGGVAEPLGNGRDVYVEHLAVRQLDLLGSNLQCQSLGLCREFLAGHTFTVMCVTTQASYPRARPTTHLVAYRPTVGPATRYGLPQRGSSPNFCKWPPAASGMCIPRPPPVVY